MVFHGFHLYIQKLFAVKSPGQKYSRSLSRAKTIKERLNSVENNSNFEISALFHHLYGKRKRATISKLELFLTEWSRSYFFFALASFKVS